VIVPLFVPKTNIAAPISSSPELLSGYFTTYFVGLTKNNLSKKAQKK